MAGHIYISRIGATYGPAPTRTAASSAHFAIQYTVIMWTSNMKTRSVNPVPRLAATSGAGFMQNCGPVESVKVMRDQNSCLSRGFGFVCFAYPQSAAAAIGCMQGYDLNGYRLYVSMSKPAKVASRYRRSTRSARELMQAWQPAYEEAAYIEYPMPTNKAFLQVRFPTTALLRCAL